LGAALAYLVIDVTILQPIGTYTNRWWEVGGGSNWWYHAVWWMISSTLAWLGAFVVSTHAHKHPESTIIMSAVVVAAFTVSIGALAVILGFPGAEWHVATFAVAVLPALALATVVSGLRNARG